MRIETPPTTQLADFLPYLLSITSNAVSTRIAEVYRTRFGLKVPEWRVMAVLGDSGALTQRELAAAIVMDKVAVNRACKVLEERGLAARLPNARDGRSHHLELTAAGAAMHGRIMPLAVQIERQLFESFTVDEREALRGLLERVRRQVGEIDPGGSEKG